MSAELGRVAYDAYRLRRGGVAYDGTAIPEWDALRPEIREAWTDAAAAVIGARSPQPAGTIDLDAARKTAREAQERTAATDRALDDGEDVDEVRIDLLLLDVPAIAALVLAMADEVERLRAELGETLTKVEQIRPVYEAAIVRYRAYFGPSARHATKTLATMNLNKAVFKALEREP